MAQRKTKRVLVVGAGPGGLTAAMILGRRGYEVEVFEKQPQVGGRNARIALGDFRFDVGPTFLMMKQVLDQCYLVGGGTHPGSGLPTIYQSGLIAADMISRCP